jgi:hypothetical protein
MAVAQWKLARVDACETALFDRFEGTRQIGHLDRISQMAVRHERSFFRALRGLERLREDRRRDARREEQAERAAQPVAAAPRAPAQSQLPPDTPEHTYVMSSPVPPASVSPHAAAQSAAQAAPDRPEPRNEVFA